MRAWGHRPCAVRRLGASASVSVCRRAMRTFRNLAIAVAVAGVLFTALIFAEANAVGLDLGMTKFVLPMVLGSGLFAGLNARSSNRRVPLANDDRAAELLAFTPRPGLGWV